MLPVPTNSFDLCIDSGELYLQMKLLPPSPPPHMWMKLLPSPITCDLRGTTDSGAVTYRDKLIVHLYLIVPILPDGGQFLQLLA